MLNGATLTPVDERVYPKITIVTTVFNSESKIPELYCRIKFAMESMAAPFEIVLVEDCGGDDSWRVLGALARFDERVTALQLMRNSGKTAATLAGMSWAKGDLIVTIDDDLRHAPEDIPLLVHRLLRDEELDVVMGAPQSAQAGAAASWLGRAQWALAGWFGRQRRGAAPVLRFTGFRVMRRQVAEVLVALSAPHADLNGMIRSITARTANETVRPEAGAVPEKGGLAWLRAGAAWVASSLGRLSRDGRLLGKPVRPLRALALVGGAGFAVSGAAACGVLGLYVGGRTAFAEVDALALVAAGLACFNFLALSLIAEHLDRLSRMWNGASRWAVRRALQHAAPQAEGVTAPMKENALAE